MLVNVSINLLYSLTIKFHERTRYYVNCLKMNSETNIQAPAYGWDNTWSGVLIGAACEIPFVCQVVDPKSELITF